MYDITIVDLWEKFPSARKLLKVGYELNAMFHTDDCVGLERLGQRVRFNPKTQEITPC